MEGRGRGSCSVASFHVAVARAQNCRRDMKCVPELDSSAANRGVYTALRAVMAVIARGFAYPTPREVLERHFSAIGPVVGVEFVDWGRAVVTYANEGDALKAVRDLSWSLMPGSLDPVEVRLHLEKGAGSSSQDDEKGHAVAAPDSSHGTWALNINTIFL